MATNDVNEAARDLNRLSIPLPRPLWIGLAALMLSVVAVGLHFGIPIYWQDAAICEIECLGGVVQSSPRGPGWLRTRIGADRLRGFDDVTGVNLRETNVTDDTVARLLCLTELRTLRLSDTAVTDAAMRHLSKFPKLRELFVDGTRITDAGARELTGLRNLDTLDLSSTEITGSALRDLGRMSRLRLIDVRFTRISDAGLAHLADCRGQTRLKAVWLLGTDTSNVAVAALAAELPQVQVVR